MAFGATLDITYNAAVKTLNRINQDNYGSEFYLREATQEFRIFIRHSKQKPAKAGGRDLDRHVFDIQQTVFATSTVREIVRHAYFVYTVPTDDDVTQANYLGSAMGGIANVSQNRLDLLNWLS